MSLLLISPSKCPKCDATYWGIPECHECGWVDPDWKAWTEEMEAFWEKHKDEIQISNESPTGLEIDSQVTSRKSPEVAPPEKSSRKLDRGSNQSMKERE